MILQLPTSISFWNVISSAAAFILFLALVFTCVLQCATTPETDTTSRLTCIDVWEEKRLYYPTALRFWPFFFLLNVFWMFERFSGWRGMLSYIIPADRPECIASYYSCTTQREEKKSQMFGKLSNNSNFPHLLFRWLAKFIYIYCFCFFFPLCLILKIREILTF